MMDELGRSGKGLPGVLLFDIEGTTTSISFVKDILFPYARKELQGFLRSHWSDPEIQGIVDLVRQQSVEDFQQRLIPRPLPTPAEENDEEKLLRSVMENLLWQMDNDRKTTGLKALQGKIWQKGYASGEINSHVYEDVPAAFDRWAQSGRKLYIYSSGSVEAQILLFKHSVAGDLLKYVSGHFDTTSGPKGEAQSYITIAGAIGVSPTDIMFFTDIPKEAYAATEAGLQVTVLLRPGNAPLTSSEMNDFRTIRSFEELF